MSSCSLCGIDRHVISRNDHWALCLNDDQAFLGRCFASLNRHETDVISLSQVERDSLWDLLSQGKAALERLFQPDHYNYVFLMNLTPHVHMHIIPRYAASREFGGITVTDTAFNAHYDPAAALILPESVQIELAESIKGVIAQ